MLPHISCHAPLNVWIVEINIQKGVEEILYKKVNNMSRERNENLVSERPSLLSIFSIDVLFLKEGTFSYLSFDNGKYFLLPPYFLLSTIFFTVYKVSM